MFALSQPLAGRDPDHPNINKSKANITRNPNRNRSVPVPVRRAAVMTDLIADAIDIIRRPHRNQRNEDVVLRVTELATTFYILYYILNFSCAFFGAINLTFFFLDHKTRSVLNSSRHEMLEIIPSVYCSFGIHNMPGTPYLISFFYYFYLFTFHLSNFMTLK